MEDSRPSWNDYFMQIAYLVRQRSTCLRRTVGAVIVRDKHIISTGYNGSPRRTQHCLNLGCLRKQLNIPTGQNHELCRGSHAELNAIVQAAAHGISTEGSIIYSTSEPCSFCTKALINAGIKAVYFVQLYEDKLARQLREEAGILTVQLEFTGGVVVHGHQEVHV